MQKNVNDRVPPFPPRSMSVSVSLQRFMLSHARCLDNLVTCAVRVEVEVCAIASLTSCQSESDTIWTLPHTFNEGSLLVMTGDYFLAFIGW